MVAEGDENGEVKIRLPSPFSPGLPTRLLILPGTTAMAAGDKQNSGCRYNPPPTPSMEESGTAYPWLMHTLPREGPIVEG